MIFYRIEWVSFDISRWSLCGLLPFVFLTFFVRYCALFCRENLYYWKNIWMSFTYEASLLACLSTHVNIIYILIHEFINVSVSVLASYFILILFTAFLSFVYPVHIYLLAFCDSIYLVLVLSLPYWLLDLWCKFSSYGHRFFSFLFADSINCFSFFCFI